MSLLAHVGAAASYRLPQQLRPRWRLLRSPRRSKQSLLRSCRRSARLEACYDVWMRREAWGQPGGSRSQCLGGGGGAAAAAPAVGGQRACVRGWAEPSHRVLPDMEFCPSNAPANMQQQQSVGASAHCRFCTAATLRPRLPPRREPVWWHPAVQLPCSDADKSAGCTLTTVRALIGHAASTAGGPVERSTPHARRPRFANQGALSHGGPRVHCALDTPSVA